MCATFKRKKKPLISLTHSFENNRCVHIYSLAYIVSLKKYSGPLGIKQRIRVHFQWNGCHEKGISEFSLGRFLQTINLLM